MNNIGKITFSIGPITVDFRDSSTDGSPKSISLGGIKAEEFYDSEMDGQEAKQFIDFQERMAKNAPALIKEIITTSSEAILEQTEGWIRANTMLNEHKRSQQVMDTRHKLNINAMNETKNPAAGDND